MGSGKKLFVKALRSLRQQQVDYPPCPQFFPKQAPAAAETQTDTVNIVTVAQSQQSSPTATNSNSKVPIMVLEERSSHTNKGGQQQTGVLLTGELQECPSVSSPLLLENDDETPMMRFKDPEVAEEVFGVVPVVELAEFIL